ncbi:MAG: thermonuclease family protein [Nitrospirota bacterium]|nr:thermonuclease family protein [Nitrospirota bacterium]
MAVLAALWLGGFAPGAYGLDPASDTALVVSVIDGDTVRLEGGRLVRYIGIDAPETRHRKGDHWVYDPQPFSEAATAENRRRVEGRTVRLEFDQRREDRFGRLLAYVWSDGEMVNEELVRVGLARAKSYAPNRRYDRRMSTAQEAARAAGLGIWTTRESPGEEH